MMRKASTLLAVVVVISLLTACGGSVTSKSSTSNVAANTAVDTATPPPATVAATHPLPTATIPPTPTVTATTAPTPTPVPTKAPTPPPTPAKAVAPAQAPDVPFARGNAARTGEQPGPGPVQSSQVAWRFKGNGAIETDPVLAGGVVYFSSQSDEFYAVDATTRQERWHFVLSGKTTEIPPSIRETRHLFSAPAVVSGAVFVGDIFGVIYRLDAATGKQQWSFQTGGAVSSSPVVVNGTVFAGSADGAVYALDAATGDQRWQFMTRDEVVAGPAVAGDTLYVGSRDGAIYALDTATGDQRWAVSTGQPVVSAVAVTNGTVYGTNTGGELVALDSGTGQERWRFETGDLLGLAPATDKDTVFVAARNGAAAPTGATTIAATFEPTIASTSEATMPALVASADQNGYLVALNATDGTQRWRFAAPDAITSAPVIAGDEVYAGGGGGSLYAVDKVTGETRWTQTIGGMVMSSPAVAGGTAYLGAQDGFLLALREGPTRTSQGTSVTVPSDRGDAAGTGVMPGPGIQGQPQLAWRQTDALAPVMANGVLYYLSRHYDPKSGMSQGAVHAVDATTGKERWQAAIDISAGDYSLITVDGGTVYTIGSESADGSTHQNLIELDATSGARIRTIKLVDHADELVIHHGVIYVSSGGLIGAIDATTGAQRWVWVTDTSGNTHLYGFSVSDNVVVVHTLTDTSTSRRSGLLALDTRTGTQRWQADLPSPLDSAPVIDGPVVYAGDSLGTLTAFDLATGSRRWRATITRNSAAISGLAAFKGTLFVAGDDGFLSAIDAASGKVQWTLEGSFAFNTPPTVADGLVYVGNLDNNLSAVDAKTGKEAWRFRVEGNITSSPIVVNHVVYATINDDTLYAIRGAAGGPAESMSTPAAVSQSQSQGRMWLVDSGEPFADPVLVGDTAYASSGDSVYAVDTATGNIRWRWKAHTGDDSSDTRMVVTPSHTIILNSGDIMFAIDAKTGNQRWQVPFDALSGFAVSGDSVLTLGQHGGAFALFSLNEQTGAQEWQGDVGHEVGPSSWPVTQGDTVFVTVGQQLYAFNTYTGKERWHTAAGNNQSINGLTVDQSNVYVDGLTGLTIAYDIHTGKERWRFSPMRQEQASQQVSVSLVGNRVLAHSGQSWYLLDPSTGAMVWTLDLPDSNDASFITTAVGDAFYLALTTNDGHKIVRVDARTGAVQWSVILGDGAYLPAAASAAAVDQYLYIPVTNDDHDGTLLMVDAATGTMRWQAHIGGDVGTPVVVGDTVYASTSAALVAYKVEPGQISGTPAASKGIEPASTVTSGQPVSTVPPTIVPTAPAVCSISSGSGTAAKGPTPAQLRALLPDQSVRPNGLTSVTDNERSLADVVAALGGSSTVEANLQQWGWSGNVERSFAAPDPTQLPAGATTNIVVSVHGFGSISGAKDALQLFADYLATQGYQEVRAPQVGDSARMLQTTTSDGTMNVALYVQQGDVLYRVAGSAKGGDPTTNVVNIAQATSSTTRATPPAPTASPLAAGGSGSFAVGDRVTMKVDGVVMRARPSQSSEGASGPLAFGESLTVVGGPAQGDDHTWYQVETSDCTTGWVMSDYIYFSGAGQPVSTVSPATVATAPGGATGSGVGTPASGEPPVVTSCSPSSIPPFTGNNPNYTITEQGLNFRVGPGSDCATLGDPLDAGTAVTVLSDPVTRQGVQWVEVQVNGQAGWVGALFIQPAQ